MNKEIKIEDFLNTEVVNFASYSTLRAIASVCDGLKNSHRKIIFGMKSTKKSTKVSILSAEIMAKSQYLHGDISGSIITLAKKYTGSNNLPLLTREGNFGSRMTPEASAIRYIFTNKEEYFDNIFNRTDDSILENQVFEGEEIEPKFYVPTIPLILVNGSEGISTGFAQKILPRDLKVLKDYIKSFLIGEALPALEPFYKGFKGSISKGYKPNQWKIEGIFERKTSTKIRIIELPIGYNLTSYTKVLDDLEDKKIIRNYTDKSDARKDLFEFEVTMDSKILKQSDNVIIEKLKLTKTVTENFTVIDENNKVVVYNSAEEVINHYIKIKLKFLKLRKDFLIKKVKEDLLVLGSKYLFLKNIVDEKIQINKVKKVDIIAQLETFDKIIKYEGSYAYLLNLPVYNLTKEKLEEILKKIKEKKSELDEISSKELSVTWSEELEAI